MPLVQNQITGFDGFVTEPEKPEPAPGLGETWGAAFRLENDVVNAWKLLNRPGFKRNPDFNVVKELKERGYWDTYRENFIGVHSQEEFAYVAGQIEQENKDRQTLDRAGWGGVVAAVGAGLLSPTLAMPLLGPARGLKGVAQAMWLAGAGAALQEAPLLAQQQTRTAGEAGFSIAASTVLGGLLGGAVLALKKGEMEALEQGMANSRGETTILSPTRVPAGAEVTSRVDAGGLKSGVRKFADIMDSNPLTRSPVTDNLRSDFNEARWTTAQLSDAGLVMERNAAGIPTTPGGTAENAIATWYGNYAQYATRADELYANYVFDDAPPAIFSGTRAYLRGRLDNSKMSKAEFRKAVFEALYNDDTHPNKYVEEAAKAAREIVYEPILKELQGLKLLGEDLPESADNSYVNWVFDHEKVARDPVGFVDFLAERYTAKLNEDFAKQYEKFLLQQERRKEALEDFQRPADEIDKLRDQFGAQLKALDKRMQDEHLTALEDTIANLKASARLLKGQGLASETQRRQMLADAKDMEKLAGPRYADAKLERRELKRRLSNLNKAKAAVDEKLANKLEKIDRAEELSLNGLNRAARAGYKFLNEMDNWSDEVLDEKLSTLKTQFETTARIYDKGEERLIKLTQDEATEEFFKEQENVFNTPSSPYSIRPTSVDELRPVGRNQNGVPEAEAVLSPIPQREYPYQLAVPKNQKDSERLISAVNKAKREAKTVTIPIARLTTAVGAIGKSKILKPSEGKPYVELIGDEYHLRDGNHRVAAAYLRGDKEITVELADMSEAFGVQKSTKALEDLQYKRADKMTELVEKIADAEDLGRDAMRSLIDDMLQDTLKRIQRINDKRAVRTARLRENAKSLSPEAYGARIEKLQERVRSADVDFNERIRLQGASPKSDALAGKADFTDYAREAAFKTKDKIMGTMLRLPVVEMMQEERGAVLPRLLGFIPTKDMAQWLEQDIEKVMKTHLRTMAPDIEIMRKLGSVNGEEQFVRLAEEMNQKLDTIAKSENSDVWKAKETARVQAEFGRVKQNLETIIGRLRHNYGLPKDPDGVGYRLAKTIQHLNVLRYMGMVTVSSIPDVGRVVMRYGLTRSMKDGFLPFVTNMKRMQLSKREAKWAGVGIEALTNARMNNLMDIMDDIGRGTKFEQGVERLSGVQGIVAGFNFWTDALKQITASIANVKAMDSIMDVVEGTNKVKGAVEFLAQNGIDEDIARRIFKEVQNGGAEKIDGVWVPNTESWTDPLAVRSFRAMVAREANNVIITPGVERPAWTNASMMGRIVSQFKSFAFSSTTKTVMAGLQQRDMAVVQGVTSMLALGAFSYYVSAMIAGGDQRAKMEKAGLDQWADEAISRSGIMAIFGLGQDLLSRMPSTAPYVSFSGGRSTRRGGDDFTEALLGPSFDALLTAGNVAAGIDDPTKSTAHQLRKLMPWQNTIIIREAFDMLEAHNGLKERR